MRVMLRGAGVVLGFAAAVLVAHGATADRPSDDTLTEWVREALTADPRIASEGVEVATERGIVTLRGSVPTLAGKRYGLLSTQRIRGVLAVVDQVDVEPVPRPDAEIVRDVERRIRRSRAIDSKDLRVSASSGVVTLAGRVGSWSQRLHAEFLSSEVRGVRGITNELVAEIESERSDDRIRADVAASLERDVYLVGLPIRVSVERGMVKLSGAVSSPYEKTRAGTQAGWVSNVRGLENDILVEWWPDRSVRVAVPEVPDDEALARTVREELAQDDRIDASAIEVSAVSGQVTLQGTVASDRQRRLAAEDVRNVPGAAWLTNELRVVFTQRPDDEVRAEIEEAFRVDSALFENTIAVTVKAGVVTVEGDVGSGYHRAHAAAIASRTRGVLEVVNRLGTIPVAARSDDALAREIERRLERDWRSGAIMARINVEVEHGLVTLSGDVDRFAERRAVERIVRRTPGVRRVRNEIVVDPYPYPWEEQPEQHEEILPEWDPHWDFPDLPWIALNLT